MLLPTQRLWGQGGIGSLTVVDSQIIAASVHTVDGLLRAVWWWGQDLNRCDHFMGRRITDLQIALADLPACGSLPTKGSSATVATGERPRPGQLRVRPFAVSSPCHLVSRPTLLPEQPMTGMCVVQWPPDIWGATRELEIDEFA